MKTDQKNNKSGKAKNHPELSTDTNTERLYRVTVFRRQDTSGSIVMPATSEKEARQRVRALARHLNIEWRLFHDSIKVYSIETLKEGGQSHD